MNFNIGDTIKLSLPVGAFGLVLPAGEEVEIVFIEHHNQATNRIDRSRCWVKSPKYNDTIFTSSEMLFGTLIPNNKKHQEILYIVDIRNTLIIEAFKTPESAMKFFEECIDNPLYGDRIISVRSTVFHD